MRFQAIGIVQSIQISLESNEHLQTIRYVVSDNHRYIQNMVLVLYRYIEYEQNIHVLFVLLVADL